MTTKSQLTSGNRPPACLPACLSKYLPCCCYWARSNFQDASPLPQQSPAAAAAAFAVPMEN